MRQTVLRSVVLSGALTLATVNAFAAGLTPVPSANPKAPGVVVPNVLSPGPAEVVRARGAMPLENPVSPAAF
jgi:hypothetical protein